MKELNLTNAEQMAFETFAEIYPIESFDLDKERFCNFFREKQGTEMTNDKIETLINEHR